MVSRFLFLLLSVPMAIAWSWSSDWSTVRVPGYHVRVTMPVKSEQVFQTSKNGIEVHSAFWDGMLFGLTRLPANQLAKDDPEKFLDSMLEEMKRGSVPGIQNLRDVTRIHAENLIGYDYKSDYIGDAQRPLAHNRLMVETKSKEAYIYGVTYRNDHEGHPAISQYLSSIRSTD